MIEYNTCEIVSWHQFYPLRVITVNLELEEQLGNRWTHTEDDGNISIKHLTISLLASGRARFWWDGRFPRGPWSSGTIKNFSRGQGSPSLQGGEIKCLFLPGKPRSCRTPWSQRGLCEYGLNTSRSHKIPMSGLIAPLCGFPGWFRRWRGHRWTWTPWTHCKTTRQTLRRLHELRCYHLTVSPSISRERMGIQEILDPQVIP